MRVFILEDSPLRKTEFLSRLRGNDITIVSNYAQACLELERQPKYDVAYLDHDLLEFDPSNRELTPWGYRERNGEDIAQFIVHDLDPAKRPSSVIVHSRNSHGAQAIVDIFEESGIRATLDPYQANPQ